MLLMYRDSLKYSHPNQPKAVKNYLAIISRVFHYVSSMMHKNNKKPEHWSKMLLEPKLVIEYLEKFVNPIITIIFPYIIRISIL